MPVNVAIELHKVAVVNQFEYKLFLSCINTSVLQSWTEMRTACVLTPNRLVTRPSVDGTDQENYAPH